MLAGKTFYFYVEQWTDKPKGQRLYNVNKALDTGL